MPPPRKLNILIIIQLIIIGLLLFRLIFNYQQFFHKTEYFVIKKNSIDFVPIDNLKNFYEPKPNSIERINQNKAPQKSTATINNDALNERFDYPIEKPENTFRILTLGDSYTYGLYVNTKDNWTEILEDKLNSDDICKNEKNYEIINLAVHGYDFQYSVKRYKLRGVKYKPDLVIWFIKDSLRITEKINQYAKAIETYLRFTKDNDKLNSYYTWTKAWDQVLADYGQERILAFQNKQLKEFSNLYQGKLLFVMGAWIPTQHQNYFSNFLDLRDHTWITNIDLLPQQRFSTDSHPNPSGHRHIALELYNYLLKNKLIRCK